MLDLLFPRKYTCPVRSNRTSVRGRVEILKRSELEELHYITPLGNIPSILKNGIVCHLIASKFSPESVAMQEIQAIRAHKDVPGGLALHQYANLYFCARNPMMRKRSALHSGLCVLKISPDVLDLADVVVADGNAASKYTAFWPVSTGLSKIDYEMVFAEWWTDFDRIIQWRKTNAKCAEVLIPNRVAADYIKGAYVSNKTSQQQLIGLGFDLPITVDPHLFFAG